MTIYYILDIEDKEGITCDLALEELPILVEKVNNEIKRPTCMVKGTRGKIT